MKKALTEHINNDEMWEQIKAAKNSKSAVMTDYATCSTCGYRWVVGMSGDHYCTKYLNLKIERLKWLIARVFEDLPPERDWLNPDYEKEMKSISGA